MDCHENDLKKWYNVRDMFLGQNYVKQDIKRALELCRHCCVDDAKWLSTVFSGKMVSTVFEARQVLWNVDDARALCFAALLCCPSDWRRLRSSAELGYSYAQVWMAWATDGAEMLEWARMSVPERDSFVFFGQYHEENGEVELAKTNYLSAAKMGDVSGMVSYGCLMEPSDAKLGWMWLDRALEGGNRSAFLYRFLSQVDNFLLGVGNLQVVFLIGRRLKGSIDERKREILGIRLRNFEVFANAAAIAINFFETQCIHAKDAVRTWSLVGLRSGVVTDLRIMIGKIIWDVRSEANYQ